MGIVCELYTIENSVFNNFVNKPKEFEDYLYENYGNPDGAYHLEDIAFFYLDKAWDIAMYLLIENDSSKEKILSKFEGEIIHKDMEGYNFINSNDVKLMNQILMNISEKEIESAYDVRKMQSKEIYRAGWFTKENNWEYILKHVKNIQLAFLIASEKNNTIIISKS
jgi:hypothetical protein